MNEEKLKDLIFRGVKEEIKIIIDEEIVKANKEVDRRMREMVDKIALRTLEHYDIIRAGNNLTITVRKEL